MQILVQHFQCWCYSYPTSTCLTAKATSVLTHLINRNSSNVSTSSHLEASSESEAKRIAISKINGRVTSATVKKEGN